MTRPGSQQIAGYYPTPPSLLPAIAALLHFPADHSPAHLLDPCAGDGTAIRTLRDLWAASRPRGDDGWPTALADALAPTHYTHGDRAHHADAFRLYPEMPASMGATVLFLNPPYDDDPEHRRLEHRFLLRFTAHLHPGAGVLLYLVPHATLETSADLLARHYLDLRAYRFPDPEYQAFRQVVLLGRRARPLTISTFAALELRESVIARLRSRKGIQEPDRQGCSRRRAVEDCARGCRLDVEANISTRSGLAAGLSRHPVGPATLPGKAGRGRGPVRRLTGPEGNNHARPGRILLSPQVLQEFYVSVTRKLARPLPPADALVALTQLATFPLVAIDAALILRAVQLHQKDSLSFWDALIVQAALEGNCRTLLSEDMQHGRRFGELTIENPFAG